jgi:hypothetical protein
VVAVAKALVLLLIVEVTSSANAGLLFRHRSISIKLDLLVVEGSPQSADEDVVMQHALPSAPMLIPSRHGVTVKTIVSGLAASVLRKGIFITVTAKDRVRLDTIVRDRNSPQKHGWRAFVLTADGEGTTGVMRAVGKGKTAVWRWQERFMQKGVEGSLTTRPGPRASRRCRPRPLIGWLVSAATRSVSANLGLLDSLNMRAL